MTPKKNDSKESLTNAQTKDKKVTAEEEKNCPARFFFNRQILYSFGGSLWRRQ
jgi:hypothetical protein